MSGKQCPECGDLLEYATPEQIEKFVGEKCGCGNVLDCCGVEMGLSFGPENTLVCYLCGDEIQ